MELKSSNILITGGTGSFGRFFVQKLLDQPKKYKRIVIYSRDELKQWELQQIFPKENYPNLRFFLGDIRDANRLRHALEKIDIVINLGGNINHSNKKETYESHFIGCKNLVDFLL